jgi:hypothetical protein
MRLDLDLLPHQAEFIEDTTTRDLALVGGRGCGKTYALAIKLITLAAIHAGHTGAALSPTGPMAGKVLIPDMLDALDRLKIKYTFNKTDRRFDLQFGRKVSTIYILSGENVRDGLGLNLAFFGLDEADTMKPEDAFESWRKLSGALRAGNPIHRQKVAVSTPEGFGFMYRHWVKAVAEARLKFDKGGLDEKSMLDLSAVLDRRIIHGRTLDNPYITDDVIADLRATYPAHYLDAYLEGRFVNMTSGTVYKEYDPEKNHTGLTIETLPDTVKTLHVGMDFNVLNPKTHPHGISIVIAAVLNNKPHVLAELYGSSKTTDAIVQIKERCPGKTILVYPDASSSGDRTSAADSDRAQLNAAGFVDMSPLGNPRIEDRVNALSAQVKNGAGERRLLINRDTCPVLSSCLAQQPYDERTNKPEKDTGYDDPIDALGYFVNVNWPVKRREFSYQALDV